MKSLSEIVVEKIPDAFDPDEILPARAQHLVNLERRGFIDGARYMCNELFRWRDPNVELPKDGEEVLVKADCPYCRYDVMKHDAFGWWEKTSLAGGGWYKAEVEITGWRPIQED